MRAKGATTRNHKMAKLKVNRALTGRVHFLFLPTPRVSLGSLRILIMGRRKI